MTRIKPAAHNVLRRARHGPLTALTFVRSRVLANVLIVVAVVLSFVSMALSHPNHPILFGVSVALLAALTVAIWVIAGVLSVISLGAVWLWSVLRCWSASAKSPLQSESAVWDEWIDAPIRPMP